MRPDIDVVHVIFKTHLDVGFTDYARNVIDRYMSQFIPDAIALAREMKQNHAGEPFCWTIGSWLVYEYLERGTRTQRKNMEAAIQDELVTWLGVPFTTHTEMMDERLFRYGLSLSQELDARFGTKTIAAKMTDVPGHTRAMIPLLAEAGIKFFHVGVNPAATIPDVPPMFIWRDEDTNTSIIMMYQHVYGDVMLLPGTSEAVAVVFTGDNLGPPSQESIHETYSELRKQFPNARFVGSNLNAVARTILAAYYELPIISSEIGDTWIHGIGTDPTKLSQYRELLRLRNHWIDERQIAEDSLKAFHHSLIMIPEHTWGMDLKTHLKDYEHYDTLALAKVRPNPNFTKFEASWTEQREYIHTAISNLQNTVLRAEAEQRLRDIKAQKPTLSNYQLSSDINFETASWSIAIDDKFGSIKHLVHKPTGRLLADDRHPLGLITYETFSAADYDRYWDQYIRDREIAHIRSWAHPDNTKPNLKVETHEIWYPTIQEIYTRAAAQDFHILIQSTLPIESTHIGAPTLVFIDICLTSNGTIEIELQWFDKPACRLPEAFWFSFQPITEDAGNWYIEKLSSHISPIDVVNQAARTLHGFNNGLVYEASTYRLKFDSLDAALVAPGKPSLLNFHNQLPDLAGGIHFNLFNNVWGTNFPMWFEDDARFRFVITMTKNS